MNTFEHFSVFVSSQILFSNSKLQFCLVVLYFGEKPHDSYGVNWRWASVPSHTHTPHPPLSCPRQTKKVWFWPWRRLLWGWVMELCSPRRINWPTRSNLLFLSTLVRCLWVKSGDLSDAGSINATEATLSRSSKCNRGYISRVKCCRNSSRSPAIRNIHRPSSPGIPAREHNQ